MGENDGDDDENDDVSIRSLFSPDPLEDISSEQPTFYDYEKKEQNSFHQNNQAFNPVQRKFLGFGVNLTPQNTFLNTKIKSIKSIYKLPYFIIQKIYKQKFQYYL